MIEIPDVLGFPLHDALEQLEKYQYPVIIIETVGKNTNKDGEARVIQQRLSSTSQIELLISFF